MICECGFEKWNVGLWVIGDKRMFYDEGIVISTANTRGEPKSGLEWLHQCVEKMDTYSHRKHSNLYARSHAHLYFDKR